MTSIDLDVSGHLEVKEAINDLKEDYTTTAQWEVSSSADYSSILEFGRGPVAATDADALKFEDENGNVIFRQRVSGHPPYPFFYPAVNEYMAGPNRFVRSNMGVDLSQASSTEEILRWVSMSLERTMKRNATASASNRSPGTHPGHPKVQTGHLRSSIGAHRIR